MSQGRPTTPGPEYNLSIRVLRFRELHLQVFELIDSCPDIGSSKGTATVISQSTHLISSYFCKWLILQALNFFTPMIINNILYIQHGNSLIYCIKFPGNRVWINCLVTSFEKVCKINSLSPWSPLEASKEEKKIKEFSKSLLAHNHFYYAQEDFLLN